MPIFNLKVLTNDGSGTYLDMDVAAFSGEPVTVTVNGLENIAVDVLNSVGEGAIYDDIANTLTLPITILGFATAANKSTADYTVGGSITLPSGTTTIYAVPSASRLSVDLTTLAGWDALSAGAHNITVVAKASGFKDSEPSAAVSVTKAATDVTVPVGFQSNFILNDVPSSQLTKTDISGAIHDKNSILKFIDSIECTNTDSGLQIKYTIEDTETIVYQNGWTDDNYKYIQLGVSSSEVTIPTELWKWLQTNATRPADSYEEVAVVRSGDYSAINNADTSKIYNAGLSRYLHTVSYQANISYDGSKWVSSTSQITVSSSSSPSIIYFYCGSGSSIEQMYVRAISGTTAGTYHLLGVLTNTWGTNGVSRVCIVEGTLITLANGTKKPIEDITYDDELLVWNFYKGKFDTAKPCWIKIAETTDKYNLCTFDNGVTIGFVGQGGIEGYHRIYNNEAVAFTHTGTNETPIGTHSFAEDGSYPTLAKQEIIQKPVRFYNVITDKHYNLFANGILTSCRLSNKYNIKEMKYVGERLISENEERKYFEHIESMMQSK